ncbi:MAG TPA: thioredoxin domain-containing protein, partial [Acetobacteraceae bacterium]|nr:thioredoxin domain-containing protein [Acetobacteraceae bacterium]
PLRGAAPLLTTALTSPDPATIVLQVQATDALPPLHPAHGKGSGPAAYLCRANVCSLPVTAPATLAKMLHARQQPN